MKTDQATTTTEQSFNKTEESKKASLREMELFNKTKGTQTNCKKCNGNGYIAEVIKEFDLFYTVVKECDCTKLKRTENEAKASGVMQLLDYTFENFNTWSKWQADIKSSAEENAKLKDWFFIGGQSGAGKTHICSAIANYQRKNRIKVKYMVWTDEINKLKNYEDTSYLDAVKRVECLYIDDLFKRIGTNTQEALTSSDITKTWELLNFRASNKLKTIISTELTLEDIGEIDESLAGRIKQKSGKYVFSLKKDSTKNMRLS